MKLLLPNHVDFLTFIAETNTFTMRPTITLFLYLLCLTAFSQNYHPFPNPTDTLSFVNADGLVRFVYLDSISLQGSTTFLYPQQEIGYNPNSNDSCQGSLVDTAWIGSKIEFTGTHIIFNHSDYTIDLDVANHNPNPIAAGTIHANNNIYYIQTSYTGTSYRSVSGIMDSVRSFSFTARDTSGNSILSGGNPALIEISRQNGLVTFPYFMNPYLLLGDHVFTQTHYQLLTRGEIFDFQVGDVFQYRGGGWRFGSSPQLVPETHKEQKVLSKTHITGDSILYEMKIKLSKMELNPITMHMERKVSHDTISIGIGRLSEPMSTQLTNQWDTTSTWPYNQRMWLKENSWNRDGILFLSDFYDASDNDCIGLSLEPSNGLTYFTKGLGLTYSEGFSAASISFSVQELVYFKKANGDTGGTKINIGLNEPQEDQLAFYPNPASGKIYFDLADPEPFKIQVLNTSGQEVHSAILTEKNNFIAVDYLPVGVYILRSESSSAKFIKL